MSQHQFFDEAYGSKPPENYQRFFVPAIGKPLAQDLIRLAALHPGERVLDVACGTGVVARLASRPVGAAGTVTGLDINPGMLAVARASTPPGMAINWHEGSAEAIPFPDTSFDVVLCQMGLQFMPGKLAALREMRRVLASGGRLILNVAGPTGEIFAVMAEAMERHVSPQAAGFITQVFSLHDTTEVQNLLSEAGFRDIAIQADNKMLTLPPPQAFLWQYVHSTPLAGMVADADEETLAALEHDVVEKWQDFAADGDLMYQQRVVVGSARK